MKHAISLIVAGVLGVGLTARASADQVIMDDLIVQGDSCIGTQCVIDEVFPVFFPLLKLKGASPALEFIDTTDTLGAEPDWRIRANSTSENALFFDDIDAGTSPFSIMANTPSNTLRLDNQGRVGIGTVLPDVDLHVLNDNSSPRIRLERTNTSPGTWDMLADSGGFYLQDAVSGLRPFNIKGGAPGFSLAVATDGDIGLGTGTTAGKLHTWGNGVQLIYFESGDGDAVQVRFRTDSENRRFLAVDNANNVKTQMQFRDDAILFLGQTVAQEWLRVDATGITTAGPTCGSPCDLTFDPEVFTVPSIEERAAYMWENMHLPAVGPTAPGEPFNLTEKTAGMLHELEVAHIYIAQLHDEQDALRSQVAELTVLSAAQQALNDELLARLKSLEER